MQPDDFTLFYVSSLAESAALQDVAAIAQTARRRNAADGITGVLVFDGSSFAQLVEGSPDALARFLDRIQLDRRHTDIEVLFFDRRQGRRRFPSWQLGYHFAEDEADDLAGLRGLRGAAALAAFDALSTRIDIGAGQQVPA